MDKHKNPSPSDLKSMHKDQIPFFLFSLGLLGIFSVLCLKILAKSLHSVKKQCKKILWAPELPVFLFFSCAHHLGRSASPFTQQHSLALGSCQPWEVSVLSEVGVMHVESLWGGHHNWEEILNITKSCLVPSPGL